VSRDEAVKAAAEAHDAHYIRQHWDGYACSCGEVSGTEVRVRRHIAEAAVTAAWPHIETAVRAQIAADIRAEAARRVTEYVYDGLMDAARIADPKETR
jgi:hypothetical protein